jgi:hypothetical protein
MATVRAEHVIFVITSKTQIFKIIAAYFTFEFINRHVQNPPEFRLGIIFAIRWNKPKVLWQRIASSSILYSIIVDEHHVDLT